MKAKQKNIPEALYYKDCENLVGQTIDYWSMKCKVVSIAKYVKPEDFKRLGFKVIYILQIIDPTEKQEKLFDSGYLLVSDSNIDFSNKNFDLNTENN